MKTLLKIAMLIILSYNLFSQNTEPSAFEFIYGPHTSPQVFNPNEFLQSKILFGFQWSGSKNMHDALGCNAYANHSYQSGFNNNTAPLQGIIQPTWRDNDYYVPGFWFAPFMNYEPTLPLTSNGSNFGMILRTDDESNPIFGFKTGNYFIKVSAPGTDITYKLLINN